MSAARWMMMSMGSMLALGLAGACALGPLGLGNPCDAGTPCPDGLTCNFPPGDGTATRGVCDYPLRAEGEPCTRAAECEEALTCSNHFTPNDRYGTCVAKREDGAACFDDRDCLSGFCAGESGTSLDGSCTTDP